MPFGEGPLHLRAPAEPYCRGKKIRLQLGPPQWAGVKILSFRVNVIKAPDNTRVAFKKLRFGHNKILLFEGWRRMEEGIWTYDIPSTPIFGLYSTLLLSVAPRSGAKGGETLIASFEVGCEVQR